MNYRLQPRALAVVLSFERKIWWSIKSEGQNTRLACSVKNFGPIEQDGLLEFVNRMVKESEHDGCWVVSQLLLSVRVMLTAWNLNFRSMGFAYFNWKILDFMQKQPYFW